MMINAILILLTALWLYDLFKEILTLHIIPKLKTMNIFKWIRGWRLDKFFANLFDGKIILADGIAKTIVIIDNVLAYEASVRMITGAASDEADATAAEIIEKIKDVREDLYNIQSLEDLAIELRDYNFSGNEETNDYIHDVIYMAAMATKDGNISALEASNFIARTILYIKTSKKNKAA